MAEAKTAAAKAATTRTRRCSNFPEALAKKRTMAKSTGIREILTGNIPGIAGFLQTPRSPRAGLGTLAGARSRDTSVPNGPGGSNCVASISFIENVSDDLRMAVDAEDQLCQVV